MPLRRRYFATGGGGEDPETPNPPVTSKKRLRIIANSRYPEFKKEYERTKEQYAKHYPGGVDFVPAYGYDELSNAFNSVGAEEDVVMMAHHNADAMFGVPVADPNMQTLDAQKGQTLSSLFSGLEKRGYKGNCYLGICHGEGVARDIQNQGVNVPIFATADKNKWVGANPGNKQSFENFFFGVDGEKDASTFGQGIKPEIGEDYKMLLSPRRQELMKRRASGTPVTSVTPLKMRFGGRRQYATGSTLPREVTDFDFSLGDVNTPRGLRTPPTSNSVTDFDFSPTIGTPDFSQRVAVPEGTQTSEGRSKFRSQFNEVLPYLSNINNAFSRLPRPMAPNSEQTVNPSLVNFSADRAELDNAFRGISKGLGQTNANPGAANANRVSAFAKILEAKGRLTQQEHNINAQIKNQTNQVNSGINARNIERVNRFNDELTSRNIKQQQLSQANLADVSNKMQLSRKDKDLMDLEDRKLAILLATDKDTGVFKRNLFDIYTKELSGKKRFGGRIR